MNSLRGFYERKMSILFQTYQSIFQEDEQKMLDFVLSSVGLEANNRQMLKALSQRNRKLLLVSHNAQSIKSVFIRLNHKVPIPDRK